MHKPTATLAFSALLLAACGDLPTEPSAASPGNPNLAVVGDPCTAPTAIVECSNENGGANSYWVFFGPPNDVPYQAAGDPYPAAPGIYLGWVAPETCFRSRNPGVASADQDLDWLHDSCELELARAFAPSWKMSRKDDCLDGEPYWAAKYFATSEHVRIAYMPAYYRDCGPTFLDFNHDGDSEFVMVQVRYDASVQHWVFDGMFISAHYGTANDHSQWVYPSQAQFTWRAGTHPTVWVSIDKHGNYRSKEYCNSWDLLTVVGIHDQCDWSWLDPLRFPVDPSHNVGSSHVHLRDAVTAEKIFSSRVEHIWTGTQFRGWQEPNLFGGFQGPAPMPYGAWLTGPWF
ncbi:MAG TPA: hypothetical protein VEW03_07060 [Longimicrobiaceae bacterium]|nr:hypothetical protein [Longimicrobiaceae bacterium]